MQDRSEVGKLVTVIKNTGNYISKEKLAEFAQESNKDNQEGLCIAKRLAHYLGGSL